MRTDRRSAPVPLPSPARPARRLRTGRGRLAARRPRALRGGTRGAGRGSRRAPSTSSARPATATPRRSPRCARRRRGVAGPGDGRALVRGALRLLPDSAERERIGLLAARAGALGACGRLADARAGLLDALALGPPLAERVELTVACAGVEHLLGRHDDAHARLLGALAALPDETSPEAAALMLALAIDAFYRSEFDSLTAWGERALAAGRAARRRGDGRAPRSPCRRSGPRSRPRSPKPRRASRRRRRTSTRSATSSWRAGSTRPRPSRSPSCTSIGSRRHARTPSARSPSPARRRSAIASRRSSAYSAPPSACPARSARARRCWTTRSRRRG